MTLSDGVKVLLLSICGYTFSYAFYFGYFSGRGIPFEFINITLGVMLKIGVTTCIVMSFFTYFIDLIHDGDDVDLYLSENTKRFIYRNSINFITGFFFTVYSVLSSEWLTLLFSYMVAYAYLRKELDISFREKGASWYKIKFKISIKPLKPIGTAIIADKFNVRSYYVYFSWYLSLLILLFSVGGVCSKITKDNLTCNDNIKVLQVNEDTVLVTSDYKEFKFMDKKDCRFTAPIRNGSK